MAGGGGVPNKKSSLRIAINGGERQEVGKAIFTRNQLLEKIVVENKDNS